MQRLALLTEVLPEFGLIDSLVVRDFYHRYTVDEHSLRTIEHLQEWRSLRMSAERISRRCGKTAERRDLLILTLLLHDVGKGCRWKITSLEASRPSIAPPRDCNFRRKKKKKCIF